MENKKYYVYGLFDPRNSELRYIGYSNNLKVRLQGHCSPSKLKKNNHKNNWIKSVKNTGIRPEIVILETYEIESDAQDAEIDLIAYYKYIGCDLTNRTKGGDPGVRYIRTEKIRQKTSESSKGRKHTEATKQQISKKLTGFKRSEENVKNISDGLKGKYTGKNSSCYTSGRIKVLTTDDIYNIKEFYFSKTFTQGELAKMFGYSRNYIIDVCAGTKDYLIND